MLSFHEIQMFEIEVDSNSFSSKKNSAARSASGYVIEIKRHFPVTYNMKMIVMQESSNCGSIYFATDTYVIIICNRNKKQSITSYRQHWQQTGVFAFAGRPAARNKWNAHFPAHTAVLQRRTNSFRGCSYSMKTSNMW